MVCDSRCVSLRIQMSNPMTTPGFQASCTPRMGDSAASAQLHGMTERAGVDHLGFSSLWRGAEDIKCMRFVDSGYVFQDRTARASAARNGNPSVAQWCAQVGVTTGEMIVVPFFRTT